MADFILEEARNQEQIQKQKAMEMVEQLRQEISQKQESQTREVSLSGDENTYCRVRRVLYCTKENCKVHVQSTRRVL